MPFIGGGSGFQEVEVRRSDEAFGVNLHTKKCVCRMWEMSGIPCVHAVAAYMPMKKDPELGVSCILKINGLSLTNIVSDQSLDQSFGNLIPSLDHCHR